MNLKNATKKKIIMSVVPIAIPVGIITFIFITLCIVLFMDMGTKEEINGLLQFNIHEDYMKYSLDYAKEINELKQKENRPKGRDYNLEFLDIFSNALTQSNDFEKYKTKYLKEAWKRWKRNEDFVSKKDCKDTELYRSIFNSITDGLVGDYKEITKVYVKGVAQQREQVDYGIRAVFPIAKGNLYSRGNDFGSDRSYGGERSHEGNDIMAASGTPIVAIEEGIIENKGWNELGGWRIGIRSVDSKRYYYYAHMSSYKENLSEGSYVKAGQVIGYVGNSGYGPVGTTGKFPNHLHLGIKVTYDIEGEEISLWVNPYHILNFIEDNKVNITEGISDRKIEGIGYRGYYPKYTKDGIYIDSSNDYEYHYTGEFNGKFVWPLPGYTKISSPFGWRWHPVDKKKKFHSGIDIPVPQGKTVFATADGVVTYAGSLRGYGNVVIIDHGEGIQSYYAHNSKLLVRKGQVIKQKDAVALSGNTGKSTGPHLHFEVKENGKAVNPYSFLRGE